MFLGLWLGIVALFLILISKKNSLEKKGGKNIYKEGILQTDKANHNLKKKGKKNAMMLPNLCKIKIGSPLKQSLFEHPP